MEEQMAKLMGTRESVSIYGMRPFGRDDHEWTTKRICRVGAHPAYRLVRHGNQADDDPVRFHRRGEVRQWTSPDTPCLTKQSRCLHWGCTFLDHWQVNVREPDALLQRVCELPQLLGVRCRLRAILRA